ncbi:MAG TPA: hypothetical protein VKB88_44955 [Bryobacteraceae bacterium]|nr:hypothetical protein [Bryobacteraceae bacterium]
MVGQNVYCAVRGKIFWVTPLALAAALGAAYTDYASAKRKIDLIESDRLRAGTRVELTERELNAYAQHEAPSGVRNLKLDITPSGLATGSALIDFNEVQRAQGRQLGWLMSKLLEGERPVSVTARITSSNHQARVDVERVTVSGLELDGATLDFLIHNVLLSVYPDAAVDRPFELAHRVERLEVHGQGVSVVIGR